MNARAAKQSAEKSAVPERKVHPLSDELVKAAAMGDEQACVRLVEQGADFRLPGSDGTTPAEAAARAGHLKCLGALMMMGLGEVWRYAAVDDDESEDDASAEDRKVFDGGEALRAAAMAGQTGAVELLCDAGVDVDSADAQGRTALHLAALYDNPATVALLIELKADVESVDVARRTPLHLARLSHSIQCARLLLAAGANPKAKDKNDKTPAALAGQARRTADALKPRFLYYVGAKSELLDAIVETIPWNAEHLIEPFAGSGAVTAGLAFRFTHIDASDANPDIVTALKTAVEEPEALIGELRSIFGPELPHGAPISEDLVDAEKAYYTRCLNDFNNRNLPITPIRRTALYVYLNRMGFKGLQRKTKKDKKFSVPFWEDRIGQKCPDNQIREFSERLQGKSTFRVRDFKDAFIGVGEGDYLYLDPPYLPSEGKDETHTGYEGTEFLESHHAELAALARKAADNGATVVVSNHDSVRIRELYKSADELRGLRVLRGMAHGNDELEEVDELLVVWKPKFHELVEALDCPLDPAAAMDPFGLTLSAETLDRLAWRAAKRNKWIKDSKSNPKNLAFSSFEKAGAQLLTIARHGTPSALRLVFGRQGRERLLGLEFIAKVVMATKKSLARGGKKKRLTVDVDTAEYLFAKLLTVAEQIEGYVADEKLRDDIMKRCLKTKLKILLNPDGDASRSLIRDRLPKRYGFAATVMKARRWTADSEPGSRLLLIAERCLPSATNAFGRICETILSKTVTETEFLDKFPAVKVGPSRGVGAQGHSDISPSDLKPVEKAWGSSSEPD